jgi:branched-subunit amino acid transport protein
MDSATLWGTWGLWGLLVLVSLATYVWRATGAVIAARIDPGGAMFQWFSCLAYGMLAGLISRIILMPVGILAETPLMDRLVALAAGFVIFAAFKRNMVPGMITAVGVFGVLATLRDFGVF